MQIQVSAEFVRSIQIQKAREVPRLSELNDLWLSCLNRIGQVNIDWGYPTVQDIMCMQNAETGEYLTDVCLKSH